MAWRREQPALLEGDITFHNSPDNTLLFSRKTDGQQLLIGLNLGDQPAAFDLPAAAQRIDNAPASLGGDWQGNRLELPAFGAAIGQL